MSARFDTVTEDFTVLSRQTNRQLALDFPRGDAPEGVLLLANKLVAEEHIGKDFKFTVEVLCDKPDIELEQLLGRMVTIALAREGASPRLFNGHVFEFRFVKNDAGFAFYQMVLLPWLAFLRHRRNNYLFNGQTLVEQATTIFANYDTLRDWKTEYLGPDDPMTDARQWDESDYNYLHRRWEAKGWHYHYEHRPDGHTLVLSGDSRRGGPIDGGGTITWQGRGGVRQVGITRLSPVRRIGSTHYAAASFDFKNPRTFPNGALYSDTHSLNRQGPAPEQGPKLEDYVYAGAYGFKNDAEGDQWVRRRMDALDAAGRPSRPWAMTPTSRPGAGTRSAAIRNFSSSARTRTRTNS